MLTGEPMPVAKVSEAPSWVPPSTGMAPFVSGWSTSGDDTVLSRIIRLVEQAQGSKAPIQRLADRVSAIFVPVVISIAVATFVVWYDFGPEPAYLHGLVAG